MEKKAKVEKGITLVALVITIVVLLILAGVTISMVLGDNGIISRAKDARYQTETKDIEEQLYYSVNTAKAYEAQTGATDGVVFDTVAHFTEYSMFDTNNYEIEYGDYEYDATNYKVNIKVKNSGNRKYEFEINLNTYEVTLKD